MLTELLRGQRINLTSMSRGDIATIVRWEEDLLFLRLSGAEPAQPRSEEAVANWLDDIEKSGNDILFAIRLLDTDALMGVIGFDDILWSHGVAGLYIGLGERENWGQGYGSEACQLALSYAFNELNLHRIQLTVFSYNQPAIALYEKFGFIREGTYREFVQRDGQRYDMHLYGLLQREWRARQP